MLRTYTVPISHLSDCCHVSRLRFLVITKTRFWHRVLHDLDHLVGLHVCLTIAVLILEGVKLVVRSEVVHAVGVGGILTSLWNFREVSSRLSLVL